MVVVFAYLNKSLTVFITLENYYRNVIGRVYGLITVFPSVAQFKSSMQCKGASPIVGAHTEEAYDEAGHKLYAKVECAG